MLTAVFKLLWQAPTEKKDILRDFSPVLRPGNQSDIDAWTKHISSVSFDQILEARVRELDSVFEALGKELDPYRNKNDDVPMASRLRQHYRDTVSISLVNMIDRPPILGTRAKHLIEDNLEQARTNHSIQIQSSFPENVLIRTDEGSYTTAFDFLIIKRAMDNKPAQAEGEDDNASNAHKDTFVGALIALDDRIMESCHKTSSDNLISAVQDVMNIVNHDYFHFFQLPIWLDEEFARAEGSRLTAVASRKPEISPLPGAAENDHDPEIDKSFATAELSSSAADIANLDPGVVHTGAFGHMMTIMYSNAMGKDLFTAENTGGLEAHAIMVHQAIAQHMQKQYEEYFDRALAALKQASRKMSSEQADIHNLYFLKVIHGAALRVFDFDHPLCKKIETESQKLSINPAFILDQSLRQFDSVLGTRVSDFLVMEKDQIISDTDSEELEQIYKQFGKDCLSSFSGKQRAALGIALLGYKNNRDSLELTQGQKFVLDRFSKPILDAVLSGKIPDQKDLIRMQIGLENEFFAKTHSPAFRDRPMIDRRLPIAMRGDPARQVTRSGMCVPMFYDLLQSAVRGVAAMKWRDPNRTAPAANTSKEGPHLVQS